MAQYLCTKCGFVYDEDASCNGVFYEEIDGEMAEGMIDSAGNDEPFTAEVEGELGEGNIEHDEVCRDLDIFPGTKWIDIPETFRCPRCKSTKAMFRKING
jgi:rubredoxin